VLEGTELCPKQTLRM